MNQSDELRVYTELSIKEPRIRLLYVTPEKVNNDTTCTCTYMHVHACIIKTRLAWVTIHSVFAITV